MSFCTLFHLAHKPNLVFLVKKDDIIQRSAHSVLILQTSIENSFKANTWGFLQSECTEYKLATFIYNQSSKPDTANDGVSLFKKSLN